MARLIQFALSQRILILLSVLLLTGAGYHAFTHIPIDAFPEVSPTQVKIIVKAPGMTPEEVEARITAPIEIELLGIPHQVMLRSIAKYALTDITVDFTEGTDIYWARQQIAERLNTLWSDLPQGIEGGIAPMTTPLGEMYMFSIEGGDLSEMERRDLLDWVIRPALRTVPGVADVNALGGLVRSFEVIPDNMRMTARDITIDQLTRAIEANNRNDGAGRMDDGEEALIVRAEGRIKTLADLGNIVIDTKNGIPITVGDVAEVRIGAMTRYGAVSKNGKGESVTGLVLSLRGANARQTIEGIENKLAEIQSRLSARRGREGVLQPRQSGRQGGRYGAACVVRSDRTGRGAVDRVSGQFKGSGHRGPGLADGGAVHVYLDERNGHVGQPDEPWRPCDRDRDAGRCGGRDRRKHHHPSCPYRESPAFAAAACDLPRRARSRGAGDLGHPDHHHRVPAVADFAGARRQAVHAGRADHRLRVERLAGAVSVGDSGCLFVPAQAGLSRRTLAAPAIVETVSASAGLVPEQSTKSCSRRRAFYWC